MAITILMPIIGIFGGILGFTGILLTTLTETATQTVLLFEGLALICLTVYFVSNWHRLKTFSARRSTRLGFNSLLAIALLVGILVIINFLAIRHGGRWDLSETQKFTLAPQTYQVLGQLKQDVHVRLFSHERSPGFRPTETYWRDIPTLLPGLPFRLSIQKNTLISHVNLPSRSWIQLCFRVRVRPFM